MPSQKKHKGESHRSCNDQLVQMTISAATQLVSPILIEKTSASDPKMNTSQLREKHDAPLTRPEPFVPFVAV
jgi:hypothetical protein